MGKEQAVVTIAERVFDPLCDAIVIGDTPAGGKISEPELAKQFDVSRASLRDGDGEMAELMMRRHIRMSRKQIEKSIK